jgi:RimJ/RimL family protein N-acetyltransferase
MERKFDFVEVTLDSYDMVKEVYRLHKEQSNKIFDLACGISTDEDIMDYVKCKIDNDIVLLAIDKENGKYAGVVIFEKIKIYNKEIARANVHLAISKKYWGKQSREIIFDVYSFLDDNWLPIRRLEARVPANNFGIIKLLKDVGFKIEGTCKDAVVFLDKNGEAKYYNEQIYSDVDRRK